VEELFIGVQMENQVLAKLIVGSRLYGMATPNSDWDVVTVLRPTEPQMFGIEWFQREGGDRSLYLLGDVVKLLWKGSFNQFEYLFAEPVETSVEWEQLVNMRDRFWTSRTGSAAVGYSISEMRRIGKQRRWLRGDIKATERKSHARFRPTDDMLNYGWDTKGAAHVVRLLWEANFYDGHHTIPFPFPMDVLSSLLKIQGGNMNFDAWKILVDEYLLYSKPWEYRNEVEAEELGQNFLIDTYKNWLREDDEV
jgi:predicted nucleotidyltransferase